MLNKQNLLLIIQREYLTRLKSKIFIVSTILAPIIMILLLVLPIMIQSMSGDRIRQYHVYDETGVVGHKLAESDSIYYQITGQTPGELREKLLLGSVEGYIVIPHEILDGMGIPAFYHDGSAGITVISRIRSDLQSAIQDIRLDRLEASEELRAVLADRFTVNNFTVSESGEETESSGLYALIGFVMGFIIYGAMIGYGAIIMRSVMEEKTSRIVEVIASAVRPLDLLMGKVIGVALLGLTQFGIWALAGSALMVSAAPVALMFSSGNGEAVEMAASFPVLGPMVWISFILFFLLGFLIYSSLFAAVGSAVDQESDSQQLQLPIIMLIIIPILFLFPVSDDPTSTLAISLSMVPFFAPILMPVRMAVISVPFWQFAVTILLMVLTFLLLIWLSSRIYRTGILMYGKKASLKELWRWVRQS